MKTSKILADNIRRRRLELNLSQEKLSEQLNVHRNTIALLEAEKRGPSLEMLEKIAKFFNCQPYELLKKHN